MNNPIYRQALLTLLLVPTTLLAQSYDSATRILTLPTVSVDGTPFSNVRVRLNDIEVVSIGATETPQPAPTCTERTVASGKASGTNDLMPGGQRIRLATSTDGNSFVRTGQTVLDRAATPSLALSAAGLPYLYYTAHQVDGSRDSAALSIGNADGTQWKHCQLTFSGLPAGVGTVDPDVVKRDDGNFRMYFTGSLGAGSPLLGIHYADSANGIDWTYKGIAFQHNASIIDSITFKAAGKWHMYILNADSIAMVYATSNDGNSFAYIGNELRQMDGQPYVISQALQIDNALRLYAFGPRGQVIRSFATSNGASLTAGTVDHLSFAAGTAEEATYIKDPAVVQLPSGAVLMAYSTAIE